MAGMDINVVATKSQKLAEEKKQLEKEVEEHSTLAMAQLDRQEVLDIVELFEEAVAAGNNSTVNNVIADLIEYIEIDDEFIRIHWNF